MGNVGARALACSLLVLAPPAFGKGRLDDTFGVNGIVTLHGETPPPTNNVPVPGQIRVAPEHSTLVTEQSWACFGEGCLQRLFLKRYDADGRLDRSFGDEGRLAVTNGVEGTALLALDSSGRILVAWSEGPGIFLRRLAANGAPDPSFGNAGFVYLACGCDLGSLDVTPAGQPLLTGYLMLDPGARGQGVLLAVARLLPDGGLDPGFGEGGIAWSRIPGLSGLEAKVGPRGAAYLFGFDWRHRPLVPVVSRVSADAQVDRPFAAAARRSLAATEDGKEPRPGWEDLSLVLRPRGRMDLYGRAGDYSVAVRLLRDGKLDRSFGRGGVRRMNFRIADAVADGTGGTFLVGDSGLRPANDFNVMRLQPNGFNDQKFGRVDLPESARDEGAEIALQERGVAVVLDRGLHFCRNGGCGVDPKLYRVLRGG